MSTRRRDLGASLLALALSTTLCLAFLEGLMRVRPEAFGRWIGNAVFSRYGHSPGTIYFRDPELRVRFMWSNFQTRAYWNGYFWQHATDELGYRNPPGRSTRGALLVGDSMIYGHGVEEEHTAAHLLESEHGRSVYNMAHPGDGLFDHYVNLRLHLESFRPESVVLFVFENDFEDLLRERTEEQLERMPEIDEYDYERLRARIDAQDPYAESWFRRLRHRSAAYRLIRGLRRRVKLTWEGRLNSSPSGAADPLLDAERRPWIERYYEGILADLAARCRALGTDLLLVRIDVGRQPEEARERARALLRGLASRLDLGYFDTASLFIDCPECQLPRDGHFTPAGHARLAEFVDGALRAREAAPPGA